ncbi:SusC/RagA family TonB-linked outer membrane protein [uncultured Bacteroides sp.]|uniref:SusC/RagA family TonB-linked outer membrane protein n=1 Tax=uncultured Bacteroides sp. TaxID=162156 RepID=UPI002AAB81E4|nr:SusC/RagA family TonB-linked outer membrane protein [uncultured Bacteroides sp.]
MKNIHARIVMGTMMAFTSLGLVAQENAAIITPADSLAKQEVNVAFRTVNQKDLMGGVSVVDMVQLTDKNYSTYSLDNMQSLVGGYNGQLWNMGDALILVDGVLRDANNVIPTEIDKITFLKGASAVVLYGSRASKGAILITTKRGREDGLQIKARGNASIFVPKSYPEYLGSAEYMTLYNEARANDGLSPTYSKDLIYNTSTGNNPYRYPNVNFFSSDYIKKAYNRYDASAEFSGGGKYAHFYTNIGIYNVGDLINFGEGKDNHSNRMNIRGNVDLRLNDWVTGWVNANATFYDSRNDNASFWSNSATLRPNRVSPLIPISYVEENDNSSRTLINNSNYLVDGQYLLGGTQLDPTNPFAAMYAAGYNKYTSRQFQFDTGINLNLDRVMKGLSFRTQFAVDYATSYSTSINNKYATYEAVWNNYSGQDLITSLNKYNKDSSTGTQNVSGSAEKQTIMFSGQFNYNRTFNKVHNISAMLLAHGYQQTISGEYHRLSNANLGLQVGYNYKNKYYVDFSGAAVHSAKFATGNSEAISPTISAAWRLSKEGFLADSPIIDDLKLNASASMLNQDLDIKTTIDDKNVEYYLYDNVFTSSGTWWGWSESYGNSMQSADSRRSGNDKLSYIKRKEFTVGLDASLWKGLLSLNANFFTTLTEGLLTTPSTIFPSYFQTYWPVSSFLPYMNYNNNRRTGFDFALNLKKKVGGVDMTLGVNGMYYTSKATKVNENVEYDYLKAQGKPVDALWGLQSNGFYKDQTDIANSPSSSFGQVKPGDIKYIDQNNDGKIDSKDQVVLGKWGAPFIFGVNFTAKCKAVTFFAALTGNIGGKGIKNNSYMWVYGDSKYSEVVRNRWTPETANTATYPRLTTQSGDQNFRSSDFWIYSTSRVDLGKVQITYDFPKNILKNAIIKGLSVYFSGSSLLTIAKERKYMEMNIGSTPQSRSYNLGLKAEF